MQPLYGRDLAYIQAVGFGTFAEGTAPEVIRLLKNALIEIRHVVEVGCGSGPLSLALTEAGFDVTGIDVSAELLRFARGAVPRARFIHASVYETEIPACDAIIAVGEPLTYHTDQARADFLVEAFFRRASQVLPAGGMLIFDVIEAGEPPLNGRTWKSGEDWAVLTETEEDQRARTLVRRIETFREVGNLYRRDRETHVIRLFDTATLLSQLSVCGFSTQTAQSCGKQPLGPRRRAFFSTRRLRA